jgi:protoporphyrinogen/coproporphyrinogen III oxidase
LIRILKSSNWTANLFFPRRCKIHALHLVGKLVGQNVTSPAAGPVFYPAIVIGAGLSGLVCAYTLRQRGLDAQLFEASDRAGGVIRSAERDGFLFELGPQSFTFTEPLRKLGRELRIEPQMLSAPAKLPRYLFLDGRLEPAPLSPAAFFASPLFSKRTKWSVLRDALGRSAPTADTAAGSESIAHFVRRKFGNEVLEKLVGPFVSGIYAGDPEKLGLRSAFPQLYAAESGYGSVVRGMLRGRKRGGEPHTLATFERGNQWLGDALAASLGSALHLGVAAANILVAPSRAPGRFCVRFAEPQVGGTAPASLYADHVIIATPAGAAGKLLASVDESLTPLLASIEYTPISVVSLGYRKGAVNNALNGFGFLAPRSSGMRLLGCVWNTSLFPGRAPDDAVLLTSFVGGALDKAGCQLGPSELENLAHKELQRVFAMTGGITEQPIISNVHTWQQAIPQYDLGHYRRTQILQQKMAALPGLALAGNYLEGPAVGAVVERARKVADYVLDGPPR